ncbi:MAG: DUF302 domain-containing protein [Gammaproteobacteria bacterium]
MSLSFLFLLAAAMFLPAQGQCAEAHDDMQPLIIVTTTKTMQQALAAVKVAIANNNYVFIRKQTINSHLIDKNQEDHKIILVYFCNFSMLHRALRLEKRVGVFLPCKITLIQKADHVEMVAINPKFISYRLKEKRLDKICKQLIEDYMAILEDASI